MASRPIYEFYAELDGFQPKIWRQFQVMDSISIARLGYIVMTLFEMRANHLFAVEVPYGENLCATCRQRYPLLSEEMHRSFDDDKDIVWRYEIYSEQFETSKPPETEEREAATTPLHHAVDWPGEQLQVIYDFGDNWRVNLTLKKVFEDKELDAKALPRTLDGAGFGIVEDCGGTSGLKKLVNAFKKKTGEQYNEFCNWLGVKEFDITVFDINDMNFRLKKVPKIYKKLYEDNLYPTTQSINLLERKYLQNEKTSKRKNKATTLRISKQRKEQIAAYATAAGFLYGVFSLSEFVDVFNHYEEEKTNEQEAHLALVRFAKSEDVEYFMCDDLISGPDFLLEDFYEDIEAAYIVRSKQSSKLRYLPDKDEFLRYTAPSHREPEKPYANFKTYIIKKGLCIREGFDGVDGDLIDLHQMIQQDVQIEELLQWFIDIGYPLEEGDIMGGFVEKLSNVFDNTRRFEHNGFTPSELDNINKQNSNKGMKRMKVGRNDPCPCSSGKKYKKCCGLNVDSKAAQLSEDERALFFDTWLGLLSFVNDQKKVIDTFIDPEGFRCNSIPSQEDAFKVREVLWENPDLIDDYLTVAKLSDEKIQLLKSWRKYHKKDIFALVEYKPDYGVLLGSNEKKEERRYGIKGISHPLADIMPGDLPMTFETVLLPFKGKIIYDSFVNPIPLDYADGAKKTIRRIHERTLEYEIITRLD